MRSPVDPVGLLNGDETALLGRSTREVRRAGTGVSESEPLAGVAIQPRWSVAALAAGARLAFSLATSGAGVEVSHELSASLCKLSNRL